MSAYRYKTEYVFHEYPKWIRTPQGVDMIVQDAEEEAAMMGEPDPAPQPKRRGRPPKNRTDDDDGAGPDHAGA